MPPRWITRDNWDACSPDTRTCLSNTVNRSISQHVLEYSGIQHDITNSSPLASAFIKSSNGVKWSWSKSYQIPTFLWIHLHLIEEDRYWSYLEQHRRTKVNVHSLTNNKHVYWSAHCIYIYIYISTYNITKSNQIIIRTFTNIIHNYQMENIDLTLSKAWTTFDVIRHWFKQNRYLGSNNSLIVMD